MKKLLSALLAAVMVMGLLTACGGSDASGNETQDATAPETNEEAAPEVQEEAEPVEEGAEKESADADAAVSEVLADGVLTVGTNAEFPPFEYVDDNGEPDGFDIALIKAIGEKLGVTVEVENMEFEALVSAIGSKIDLAIACMTVTDDRHPWIFPIRIMMPCSM